MEEEIISKKDFIKHFEGKNIIDKSDYLLYKKMKESKKIYSQIGEKFNYFLTTKFQID